MSRTPIVALTAHAMLGDREKCIQAQMDEYLSKPLKQNTLIQVILKVITRNGRYHPEGIRDKTPSRLTNIGTVRDSWRSTSGKRQRTTIVDTGRQRAGEQSHKRSKHDQESAATGAPGGDSSSLDPSASQPAADN